MWVHTDPATHSSYLALEHRRLHCLAWMSPLLRAVPRHTSYTQCPLPCFYFLLETALFVWLLLGLRLTIPSQWEVSFITLRWWSPVPGTEGSSHMSSTCHLQRKKIPGHCILPAPRQTQMKVTDRAYGTANRNAMSAYFFWHVEVFKGGTCTPHPSDFTFYSRKGSN